MTERSIREGALSALRVFAVVVLAGAHCVPARGGNDPGPDAADPALVASVREILSERCLACHSAEVKKGGLDLSRRASALAGGKNGPAVVAGKADESLMLDRLDAGEMPPDRPLGAEQVAAVRAWVARGASYGDAPLAPRRAGPDWWSLRPVRRPAVPAVRDPGRARTPVDAFVLERLDAAGLRPAPEADRAAWLRRVTFDLTGLPPGPGEVLAFAGDASPGAFGRVVERLLASPHYGERWGRHWLDVVRFAESHGYETNQLRPAAWPYRDYVVRAFNTDVPFPRFVEEQFAGDAVEGGDWLVRSATGFLVGGAHDTVGNQTVEGSRQQRADDLDDMITAAGTAFLGLTVHCARCHDHKFDPVTQRDYYGLQAVLAGVQHADREIPTPDAAARARAVAAASEEIDRIDLKLDTFEPAASLGGGPAGRPPVNPRRNVERFAPVRARFVRFRVRATNTLEPCLDELQVWTPGPEPRNVAEGPGVRAAASSNYPGSPFHKLEHINDGRFGNSRSWISAEPGAGWVQIETPEAATIDRVVWGRDREGKFEDRLATRYTVEAATEPGAWRAVASSADRLPFGSKEAAPPAASPEADALRRRRKACVERRDTLASGEKVYAGTFTEPGPTHVLRRGDPMQPGEEVSPSAVKAVRPALAAPPGAGELGRRRALARWVADPENPLPARVMVNRVWHYHFGQGLVRTPSDLGFNGDRPSHPELLDWLAAEYLAGGGRLKPIHRAIVLSAAYRRSGRFDPAAHAADATDRLLWRVAPRRLEAEAIRDAVLDASGALDRRMGGPGYNPWEPNTNYVAVFRPKAAAGPDDFRRMVYQFRPRSQVDPTFGVYDCPDGGLVAPRRGVSTTALQALNLLNSEFILTMSGRFADRLAREAGAAPEAQAVLAFRLAFGRDPLGGERSAAAALIRDHGAATLGRALFNANEFVYIP